MREKVLKIMLMITILIGYDFFATNMIVHSSEKVDENGEQEWWTKKQQFSIPEQRGGSEYSKRHNEEEAVSMKVLEQKYPDIVSLQGSNTENRVAITFDDGPDPRFTPGILDALNEYDVPATFFLMGARAEKYPGIAQRIVEEGHVAGNHTFWHPDLMEQDMDTFRSEVTRTEDTISDVTGYHSTLFRPPYGFLKSESVKKLEDWDKAVIGWSVDSLDWNEDMDSEHITKNVLRDVHPGAIILMHDGAKKEGDRTETIEALHEIIPALQDHGMEFVPVSELLNNPHQKEA